MAGLIAWLHRPRNVPIDMNAPLTSVLRHNGHVFACSEMGLYRAGSATHAWVQLRLSPFVPRGGRFIAADKRLEIYYLAPACPVPGTRPGLWRSRDSGVSWKCVLRGVIQSVYVSPGGIVYTHQYVPTQKRVRLLMSRNAGDDWEDIPHDIGWVSAIVADPSDPERIAGERYGGRRYLVRARDSQYQWQQPGEMTPISFWTSDLTQDWSPRGSGTQTILHMANATLATYFDEPFGDWPVMCAFDVVTARPAYHVSSDGSIPVEMELRCYSPRASALLTDADDPRQFWSLMILDPEGKSRRLPNRQGPLSQRRPATAPVAVPEWNDVPDIGDRTTAGFHTFTVDKAHPYRRTIEMSRFCAFSSPGRYRIRICYNNMGDSPIIAGEWHGFFEGETFTVIVEKPRPR